MGYLAWKGDELMIPAAGVGMSDKAALHLCSFDGAPIMQVERTLLVSETWARKQKPEWTEVFDKMRDIALGFKD